MQRINSGRLNFQQNQFDPLRIARAAQTGASIIAPVVEGLDAVANKRIGQETRDANLFARVEASRVDREVATALVDVRAGMAETGAGYASAATAAYDRVTAEALARAGDNPRRRQALEEQFRLDRENQVSVFETGERDFSRQYSLDQHLATLDDARQGASRAGYAPPASGAASTLGLIRSFEGFSSSAYWDVNAQRAGYGSDTVTRADGTVERVTRSTKVSREDAERDLARRADEFAGGVREKIGNAAWSSMGSAQRAALTSIAYNYGSLPDRVSRVIAQGGDVAAAIDALGSDNDGINADRREAEANVFRTGHMGGRDQNGVPVHTGEVPDIWGNPIVSDARGDLYAQIDALDVPGPQRAQLKRQVDNQLATAAVAKLGNDNPAAALALLRSGQLDGDLEYGQDQSLQGSLVKTLESQFTALAKEREKQDTIQAGNTANDFVAWQESGRQGEAPPALSPEQLSLLTPAQQNGYLESIATGEVIANAQNLDPSQLAAYRETLVPAGPGFANEAARLGAFDRVAGERMQQAAVNAHIDGALASGVAPNTSDADVRNEMDRRFAGSLAGSDDPFGAAAQFIAQNKVAPAGFGQMVGQALGSDDPALQEAAIEAVGRLNAADPRLLADVTSKAIDRAVAVNEFQSLGMSTDDAMKHTAGMLDPAGSPLRAARAAEWNADKGKMEAEAWDMLNARIVERGRDLGLGRSEAAAAVPSSVWSVYSDMVKEQYQLTGNVGVAVAVADRAFFAVNAVTRVGGVPVWQNGAPEAFPEFQAYADPEENSAYIEDQAIETAAFRLGRSVENVMLEPIGDVMRDKAPSYRMMAVGEDGEVVEVPGFFRPDPEIERAMTAIEFAFAPENAPDVVAAREEDRTKTIQLRQLAAEKNRIVGLALTAPAGVDPDTVAAWAEDTRRITEEMKALRSGRAELVNRLTVRSGGAAGRRDRRLNSNDAGGN